ncbi:MAG TPA: hypothetical protein VGB54_00425 [Allosphingosinicella sp.]
MKNVILFGAVLASGLALSACNQNKAATNSGAASTNAPAAANSTAPASTTANSSAPAAAPGDATNQNFTIRNRTGHVVTEVYVSAISTNDWEEDVLGRDTLPNGESVEITFERAETQCNWDLKLVFDDGTSLEQRNVNLCRTGEIEVTS